MPIGQEYMDTGYGPVDEEHRAISEQVRALLSAIEAADAEQARAGAHLLFKRVASHFAHEERLMEQWRYPALERHRGAHASFLEDARRFSAELDATGVTPSVRRWAVVRLATWFKFHIVANDVDLGLFLRTQARRTTVGGEPPPR